jgi:hypothetical protein
MSAAVTLGASGILSPILYPQAYDVIQVGTVVSPGVCYLSGFKRVHEFDKKKGKGTQGATLTFVQKPPMEGTVKFLLGYTPASGVPVDMFAEWGPFAAQLKYDPTKKTVQAVDVYHPSLAFLDATSFVCTEIGGLEIEGEPGHQLYSITIKLCEYNPPAKKSAVGTPTTAIANASGDAPTQPVQDAQQVEIASLLAQAAAP